MDTHCFSACGAKNARRAYFVRSSSEQSRGSHDATLANHANQRRHFQADLSISARFPPKEVMGCLTTRQTGWMARLSHHRLTVNHRPWHRTQPHATRSGIMLV